MDENNSSNIVKGKVNRDAFTFSLVWSNHGILATDARPIIRSERKNILEALKSSSQRVLPLMSV
jgi:hypothetical protein